MEATIFDTSPKVALGFWPLMAAWVSLKNNAYADTGFAGSLGSFFLLPFFAPSAAAVPAPAMAPMAGLPPTLRTRAGEAAEACEVPANKGICDTTTGEEDRETGGSMSTLWNEGVKDDRQRERQREKDNESYDISNAINHLADASA